VQNGNVELITNVPENLSSFKTDISKLKQILINLIGNAIKFTDEGSVKVEVEMYPDNHMPHMIHIIDTGIGIPPEKLSTIFDSFQQVESKVNRKYEGTGLGLSITKALCDMLGYGINVTSEISKGSTFTITIQYTREISPSGPGISHRKSRNVIRQKKKIESSDVSEKLKGLISYVIDSESDSRILMEEYLHDIGCKVFTSSSLDLNIIRDCAPKVMIISHKKRTLIQKQIGTLKAEKTTRNIPLIIVSNRAKELRTSLHDADEFINKPVQQKTLMWAMARCILDGKKN